MSDQSFVSHYIIHSKLSLLSHRLPVQLFRFTFTSIIILLSSGILAQQIRIMPLGDSITHGVHGSDPIGGFRDDLADKLLAQGINFDLVGTLNDGTSYYPYHEGHPGKTAEYLAHNITTWLNATYPDIVLLHIGTNDVNSHYSNSDISHDIENVLTAIWSYNTNIPVLLCSVIPRNDSYNTTNTDLCRFIHQLAVEQLAEGKLIRYVGQNEVWVTNPNWRTAYIYDTFHPNNQGYHVMAEVYFNLILNQLTGVNQFITDNFNRTHLGMTWNVDSPYIISGNKLTVSSGNNSWHKPAVYIAEMDPIAVAFEWGSHVNPAINSNAGIALHLQNNQTNTNGYLVYKDSETKNIKLYLIGNGTVTQLIDEVPGKQDLPISGDQFHISMYHDFQGQHFACFINDNYDGDVLDSANTYINGDNHFAGIMLAGAGNNIIDNFQLVHVKGTAEKIYAVWGDEQQGNPGTRLADSLVAMVTDINGNPISGIPVSFALTEGDATIEPPEMRNHFESEAEHGDITYPMQIMNDGDASGGKYVEVPAEYPDNDLAKVSLTFNIATESDFVVWGRVQSGDGNHDSFKVMMDQQSEIIWHISGKYDWTWDQVYDAGGNDPIIFHLTAGTHTLKISNREWGSKLDKLIITDNMSFNPSTLTKPVAAYYITNGSGKAHAIVNLGTTPGLVKIKACSPNFSDYTVFTAIIGSSNIPATIAIIDGNNQLGKPNQTLPNPFIAEVTNTENKVIPHIKVKFEITQGTGASLGNSQPVLTNDQGQASTTLTLGPNFGPYLVQASCPGSSIAPVTFQATATNALFTISGYCKYYKNNVPINNVRLKTSGTGVNTVTSNIEGFYQLPGLETGGSYTVIPERAVFNNWSAHLITTYQAALTLRYAVGLETFTLSQIKAADVDKSGKVTSYDAALIAQFAVGLPRLADSYAGEWLFIPAFRSYFDLNSSYQDQDYTGILLGDVTGDWKQSYNTSRELAPRTIDWIEDIRVDSNEIINIPINIEAIQPVISWQLHLQFDPSDLQLIAIEKGKLVSTMQLIKNQIEGEIYLGMYGTQAINLSDPFLNLKLKILKSNMDKIELDIPYFQVNNNPVQQGQVEISVDHSPETFVLLQNYPNPFNSGTTISYQIPDPGLVQIILYNSIGQEIIILEDKEKQAGSYQIEWDGLDSTGSPVTSGIYFCHLYYRDQLKTIKLVKVK